LSKRILINIQDRQKRIAILEEGKLEGFYIERTEEKSLVGNIYKAKVRSVVASIGAAFLDIGEKKNGFLYLSDVSNPLMEDDVAFDVSPANAGPSLRENQEILVQVVKDPFGRKGPRLTTRITLPGRFMVLMPGVEHLGVSRRIEDENERRRLRQILQEAKISSAGLIVRTAAKDKSRRALLRDAHFLIKLWQRIKRSGYRRAAPCLLHREHEFTLRIMRDYLTEDVDRLIVDSRAEFFKVRRFLKNFAPGLVRKLELYRDRISLFEKENVERLIGQLYQRIVPLRSGGYIVIEPTEALVAIDVNSGSFKGKKGPEGTAFTINMEAAGEIARQLRLRDIGGLIVIDFIDMSSSEHRRQVLNKLKQCLESDRAKTDVSDISNLGLVEMTRERKGGSIEAIAYEVCPYCQGRGKIKKD
jgi:ribonuclease G